MKEKKKLIVCIIMLLSLIFLLIGCSKKGLSLEDDTVKKLYDMVEAYVIPDIYPDFASYDDNNFYMDREVKYEDLSDEARLYYAYKTIDKVERRWFSTCDELKGYTFNNKDVYKICVDGGAEIIAKEESSEEWFFNNVDKKTLENAYQNMYGQDKEMPLKDFTMSFTGVCLYSKEKDNFLCFNQTGGDTTFSYGETKIERAVRFKDAIVLYDRYVWVEYSMSDNSGSIINYYKSRFDKKELISSKKIEDEDASVSNDVFKKGALYKHTFKIDKNGEYYWFSSERVK